MRRVRDATLALAVAVLSAPALGGVAHASSPTARTLTVPGDGGPTSATWQGASLSGLPILPSVLCLPSQCDEEQLLLFSRDPAYTTKHTLTLTVSITYNTSAGRVLDLSLLTASKQPLKEVRHVGSGQQISMSGIGISEYFVRVVSDTALRPTSYVGYASLAATNAPHDFTLASPATKAAPPLYGAVASPVGLPSAASVGPTVQPGVRVLGERATRTSQTAFGKQPIIAPARVVGRHSSRSGLWWLVTITLAALGLWVISYLARDWWRLARPRD